MPMLPHSFYFLRHGETDWNKEGRIQGLTDIPLNQMGRSQAQKAVGLMKTLPIDRIVCSTLDRAHETARIVNQGLQKPLITDANIVERNFGAFEGMDVSAIEKLKAEMMQNGQQPEENGYPCPPEGESYGDFRARTIKAFTGHLNAFQGQNILFVAHGGLYRVLRRCLFGHADSSPNVQPFHFEKGAEKWILHTLTV